MQDFTKAKEAADEAARMAGKVEDYMPKVEALLQAFDEAESASIKVEHDGAPGVWIPKDEWEAASCAHVRAW